MRNANPRALLQVFSNPLPSKQATALALASYIQEEVMRVAALEPAHAPSSSLCQMEAASTVWGQEYVA